MKKLNFVCLRSIDCKNEIGKKLLKIKSVKSVILNENNNSDITVIYNGDSKNIIDFMTDNYSVKI